MSNPTVLSYTVRDELGTEASCQFYINYDGAVETVQALIGEWLAAGALVDAVTGGQIVHGRITIPVVADSSWKSAPASGSRVEQTALINFSTASNSRRNGFDIPAVKDALISGGKLLVASGALKALADALIAAFTNGAFATAGGESITNWVDAVLSFRKHRKQLTRSSVEYTAGL